MKIMQRFILMQKKHLKVALNKGVLKFAVPFIQGQCTFWPILDAALNF